MHGIHGLSRHYLLVIPLFFLLSAARADNTLLKDMVHFDQAYIPVLALTSAEQLDGARKTMASLKPAWQSFKKKHYSNTHGDSQWQADLDKVDNYIKASEKIIQSGTMIKDAHEELEHVRVVFMQLRERNNIEYYIDHLTRFHEPMETIVLTVKGKNEESLALKDIIAIRKTLPEARQLWHITSSAKFDASLYEFDKNKTAQLHALVKKQQQSLKQLEKAIKKGSMTEIIQAGLAIKPGFAKLFKAFGHFPASQ